MEDYLVEVIFKNISIENISSLLKYLCSKSKKITNYYFTGNSLVVSWDNEGSIKQIFLNNQNFGLFINLDTLNVDNLELFNCGIAVYKSKNTISIEINFKLSDLKNCKLENLVQNLMSFAQHIAKDFIVDEYFGGLEPAEEVSTRLFTKNQIGPFSFKTV